MDNSTILHKLEEQEKKIDKIYKSVEQTRKYFMWTLILTAVFFALPLIGMAVILPSLISNMSALYDISSDVMAY